MKIIFSDFDGTLTAGHRFTPQFFDILDLIHKNNSELVIVSGRSISWGHFLLSHFPLKTVIMEGGGVICRKSSSRVLSSEFLVSDKVICDLDKLTKTLVKKFPGAILSEDSKGRITDRALEYPFMQKEDLAKVEEFLLQQEGVTFSKSNVHLNYWMGDISKFGAVEYYLSKLSERVELDETLFYGDSLNDETMFEKHPNTIGVSNILMVIDKLKHRPKVVLEGKDMAGPSGVIHHLKEVFDNSVDF